MCSRNELEWEKMKEERGGESLSNEWFLGWLAVLKRMWCYDGDFFFVFRKLTTKAQARLEPDGMRSAFRASFTFNTHRFSRITELNRRKCYLRLQMLLQPDLCFTQEYLGYRASFRSMISSYFILDLKISCGKYFPSGSWIIDSCGNNRRFPADKLYRIWQ